MSKLALLRGEPIRKKPFLKHPTITEKEYENVERVLKKRNFSTFIAQAGPNFLGGEEIKSFEKEFAEYHDVKHAVAVNSATAALHCAVVATGVQPGQEVIVPPYTFTSTATCALMHNAVPVFVDIDEDIFCISPINLEERITEKTAVVIPVHLFGHPADMDEINQIAKKYDLKVIEDCAQAPGCEYKGKKVGTLGDCGIFSFTESKTIMTGEGGMLITNDYTIADIARMVRNHGEVLFENKEREYISHILGWNYRMTELAAALGRAQFGRLDKLNEHRRKLADYLTEEIKNIEGVTPPKIREDVTHGYFLYTIKIDEELLGISRDLFVKALQAEGIPFGAGYVRPLYLNPLYQEKRHVAFDLNKDVNYEKGICPVAERMHYQEVAVFLHCRPPCSLKDMNDVLNAFHKIVENKEELKGYEN